MTTPRYRFLLAALVVLSAGCATQGQASGTDWPPVSPADVNIYQSPDDIDGEYEVLVSLRAPDRGGYGADRDPLDTVRREAGRLGANGILVVNAEDEAADARIRAATAQGQSFSRTQYVAIYVYTPPAP